MNTHYDFIAIGGGSAGYNGARAATEHAERVAVVDGAPELGGLCILKGCMPSKTLLYVAEVLHRAKHGERLGLQIPSALPDMNRVAERKRRIIGEFADYRARQINSGNYTVYRSFARFVGPNEIELSDGARLTADRFLIGTGSVVSTPPIPGLRESKAWTSDDILDLDFVPESVIVLGGGIVAAELTQYLGRMGSRITLIQRSPHILRHHSPEAAQVIETALRDDGIEVITGTHLDQVAFDGSEYTVRFSEAGQPRVRRARHLFNALGRSPNTGKLNLEAVGVDRRENGQIVASEFQQTTAAHIYAAGDCTGPNEIVHIAIAQAEIAVRHAFGRPTDPIDTSKQVDVVFTDPQLARLGLAAAELDEQGIEYVSASYPFDDHGKAILMEATYGYVKVLADPGYGRILGAEIVGRDAGELIHIFSTVIAMNGTAADMLKASWYHPTLAEIITYPLEEIVEKIGVS
ncbi:MAG: pyridine nucleotide-disulfide oxidoreductase [Verrucomicrobia bacterium]|nr:MAG: pyridine nucleotide-disulfide oxidoreductase [Verrucomicrobiota bacterium]